MASRLSKYDVFLIIHSSEKIKRNDLFDHVRDDARFAQTGERPFKEIVRVLKNDRLIVESNDSLSVNPSNDKTWDLLAFIYWSRLRGRDYDALLDEDVVKVFRAVYLGSTNLKEIVAATALSKPTVSKMLGLLADSGLIEATGKRPAAFKALITDHCVFYINLLNLPLNNAFIGYCPPKIRRIHSKKLVEELIRLHTYSSTVTEGNTASEDDVDKVFSDLPVKLTAREVMEIVNTRAAVVNLFKFKESRITEERIKELHGILMNRLIDSAGRYYYARKRIVGSDHKPPGSKEEIDASMNAFVNFINKYFKETDPLILAPLAHLVFVSIHPFQDGNGRLARLLHSWILIKKDLPLFAYDPQKKIEYFTYIDQARKKDAFNFVEFCNREQMNIIEKNRSQMPSL
jgi:Fic family protein